MLHIHFHSSAVSAQILKTNMIVGTVSRNVFNTSEGSTWPFTVHLNIKLIHSTTFDYLHNKCMCYGSRGRISNCNRQGVSSPRRISNKLL